ncbi:hypothetical protein M0802_002493 [Mischocyttarus mexicanus]|nr:hypothetical protein M0802_002493 [Mischocyttarus mexicanus]
MSLTISFLAFDLSIPILIHGIFTLIFLRRVLFDIFGKLLSPIPYQNPYVRFEKYYWKKGIGFLKDLYEPKRIMGSTRPQKNKTQETETNGVDEIDTKMDQVLSTNSMDTASVQAKMSLDLIVEQLKHEISLKDMEDYKEHRSVLINSTTIDDDDYDDDDAVGPKDLFPIVSKDKITKIDLKDEKETTGIGVPETTDPIEVNVISMNLKKYDNLEEEKHTRKDRQEVGTILPGDTKKKNKKEDEIKPSKIPKRINVEEKTVTKNRFEKDKEVRLPSTFGLEKDKRSFDRTVGRKINEGENTLTRVNENVEKESKDGVSQTERAYTIHAAKSCPFRKKRIYLGVAKDTYHKEELLERIIHRKASDNLIYEKSKASGSPSYVPITERFRWRYVSPRKAR